MIIIKVFSFFHWMYAAPVVLLRPTQTPLPVYLKALQVNPELQSVQDYWLDFIHKNSLSEAQIQNLKKITSLMNSNDLPKYLESFTPSFELYQFLKQFQTREIENITHLNQFCEHLESLKRKWNQTIGGEDITIFVNGDTKRCSSPQIPDLICLDIVSSALALKHICGPATEIIDRLENLDLSPWVEGNLGNYHWSLTGFLANVDKALVWNNGSVEYDQWTTPKQMLLSVQKPPERTSISKQLIFVGLALIGGLWLHSELQNKEIIISF